MQQVSPCLACPESTAAAFAGRGMRRLLCIQLSVYYTSLVYSCTPHPSPRLAMEENGSPPYEDCFEDTGDMEPLADSDMTLLFRDLERELEAVIHRYHVPPTDLNKLFQVHTCRQHTTLQRLCSRHQTHTLLM